ncbi:MAG TPA: DUF4129 domain-containing protein [Methylomirabilota bacterium]|nr:DUF4129 domain-containing protein [Methylomirabilota bacterium]
MVTSNRIIILLFIVLLIMTGAFTQQTESAKATLGVLAPFLPPAFLTFYLIILLVFSRTIIDAVSNFFVVGPSGPRPGSSLLTSLLFFLFVVITIVAVMRGNPSAVIAFLGAIQQAAALFSSATQLYPASTVKASTGTAQLLFLMYYSLIAFVSIFVISLSFLLIAFRRGVITNRTEAVTPGDTVKRKATAVVRNTVRLLMSGNNYQETILDCYRQMCTLLAEIGLEIGLAQTPREFALQASKKLRFGKEAVNTLTFLFEEARYSQHSLGDDKRAVAISQLSTLENELAYEMKVNIGEPRY